MLRVKKVNAEMHSSSFSFNYFNCLTILYGARYHFGDNDRYINCKTCLVFGWIRHTWNAEKMVIRDSVCAAFHQISCIRHGSRTEKITSPKPAPNPLQKFSLQSAYYHFISCSSSNT